VLDPRRRLFRAVIVAEIVVIALLAVWTVESEHVWYGDELVHLSVTKYVAEHGSLPVLGRDVVPNEILELNRQVHGGRMACPATDPNRPMNLCGVYEAFQPPLYYLLSVPAYELGRWNALGGSEHRALIAVRMFGIVLLLTATALLLLLTREVVRPAQFEPVAALALVFFLFPGTVVRFVLVANAALEIPLTLALIWLLWRAWTRNSAWTLAAASAVFGLCLLTKLTLVPLIVPLALTAAVLVTRRRHRLRRALPLAALVVVIPTAILMPWIAFNQDHYGDWTANALARRIQAPVINPTDAPFPLTDIAERMRDELERIPTPQEWSWDQDRGIARVLRGALLVIFFVAPALLALATLFHKRRRIDPRSLVLLWLPLPTALAFLAYETSAERWNVILSRYFLYAIAPLVVWSAQRWRSTLGNGARYTALVGAVIVCALSEWLVLAPGIR